MRTNLVKWLIFAVLIGWTVVCVEMLWQADLHGGRYGIDHPNAGNFPTDLPFDYYWLIMEMVGFMVVLRPESYDLRRSVARAGLFIPLALVAWVYHMFQLMHAGSVHGWMMNWLTGMVAIGLVLLLVGLYLRIFRKLPDPDPNP